MFVRGVRFGYFVVSSFPQSLAHGGSVVDPETFDAGHHGVLVLSKGGCKSVGRYLM